MPSWCSKQLWNSHVPCCRARSPCRQLRSEHRLGSHQLVFPACAVRDGCSCFISACKKQK
eukprot:1995538-Rhodomonas_salina.2